MDPFLWDDYVNVDELIGDNVTALVEKSRSVTLGKTRQGTYFASGVLHSGVSYFASGNTMHEMTVRTLRAMEVKEKASAGWRKNRGFLRGRSMTGKQKSSAN